MAADIFISFASKDVKVALTLCSAIESRGFKCWISARDIQPGENFQVSIVRALRGAKILLLVFTANSNASEEMTKELALASQQKMIVIPLRVEDVAPSDAFAYEFATRQWIDVFADWEFSIEQLCRRIEHALSVHSIEAGAPSPALDHAEEEALAAAAAAELAAPAPIPEAPAAKVEPAPPASAPVIEPVRAMRKLESVAATETAAAPPAEKDPTRHSGRIALVAVIIALAAMLALAIPMLTRKQAPDAVAADTAAQPAAAIDAAAPIAPDPAIAAAAKAEEDALAAEKAAAEKTQRAAAQRRAKTAESKANTVDIPF